MIHEAAFGMLRVGGRVIREGDTITIDGGTGEVMEGSIPTVIPELGGPFNELMTWAEQVRTMQVRTNADTPQDAKLAREFGAETDFRTGFCSRTPTDQAT